MNKLVCPLDGGRLTGAVEMVCPTCQTTFPLVQIGGKSLVDFRCVDKTTTVALHVTIPQTPLPSCTVEPFGKATEVEFKCPSREELRQQFGTKLQKEILYYIDGFLKEKGPDAAILDLGCGNGGNKRYLASLGFTDVLAVDYKSSGAEYLVDAHRLPFAPDTFDMIITTATIDAFYNPFAAFHEMSRVLKKNGVLIASGSFWEGWHGISCFHCTPGGLKLLCESARLELVDVWSGWGFIPAVSSYALGMHNFRKITYPLQRAFDAVMRRLVGREAAKKHRFMTSGSFGLYARKQ